MAMFEIIYGECILELVEFESRDKALAYAQEAYPYLLKDEIEIRPEINSTVSVA